MFVPNQIVYLKGGHAQLYGEVIQALDTRQICWVRPIALVYDRPSAEGHHSPKDGTEPEIYLLPDGPDLLWPTNQFRLALDTDVLPLLASINRTKAPEAATQPTAHQRLQEFVRTLWDEQSENSTAQRS